MELTHHGSAMDRFSTEGPSCHELLASNVSCVQDGLSLVFNQKHYRAGTVVCLFGVSALLLNNGCAMLHQVESL